MKIVPSPSPDVVVEQGDPIGDIVAITFSQLTQRLNGQLLLTGFRIEFGQRYAEIHLVSAKLEQLFDRFYRLRIAFKCNFKRQELRKGSLIVRIDPHGFLECFERLLRLVCSKIFNALQIADFGALRLKQRVLTEQFGGPVVVTHLMGDAREIPEVVFVRGIELDGSFAINPRRIEHGQAKV
jgi:hypothetical protein